MNRAFLNNVVTSTLVFEGDGVINQYVGGYDDWYVNVTHYLNLRQLLPLMFEQNCAPGD